MINRNFVSPQQATTWLRSEGFKPITTTPRTWKKVDSDHRLREVRLHIFSRGLKVKVVEVRHES